MLKIKELVYSLIAMIFITLFYLLVQISNKEIPSASSFWGHSLGVLGFLLMVMTETLYSFRKRSKRGARWGKMSSWLEFHIFTGIVGPFMVLLHPGWEFKGLAGVLSLMTLLIVFSGFFGRYIYTSIPRTTSGSEIDLKELEMTARRMETEIARLKHQDKTQPIQKINSNGGTVFNVLSRFWIDIGAVFTDLAIRTGPSHPAKQTELELLRVRRKYEQVQRQINDLAAARKLLSLWHAIHIPLGLTLFLVALVHIGATIYYAILIY
ncbi:MAG: hypothetical protein BGO78_09190 [Chloroflexi bacterium 44-23]|nr:MAG: hypothetical protein BGO78_09190 [Chloroflexi bacterium 44-23]